MTTSVFLSIFLLTPSASNAVEFLKEEGKNLFNNEDFFMEGDRKIRKLFKEIDYRPVKDKVKNKVIPKTLKKNISNAVDVTFTLPVIDLTPFFVKDKIIETVVQETLPKYIDTIPVSDNLLFLRGGFAGYVFGKLADKISKKVEGWVSDKIEGHQGQESKSSVTKEQTHLLQNVLDFLKKNPVFAMLLTGWVILKFPKNKDKIKGVVHETLPKSLANTLVGEIPTWKTYLFKFFSLKEPYIYITVSAAFFITYKTTLSKLFRREMTPSEAISTITSNFLATNSQFFEKINNIFKPGNEIYFENFIHNLD